MYKQQDVMRNQVREKFIHNIFNLKTDQEFNYIRALDKYIQEVYNEDLVLDDVKDDFIKVDLEGNINIETIAYLQNNFHDFIDLDYAKYPDLLGLDLYAIHGEVQNSIISRLSNNGNITKIEFTGLKISKELRGIIELRNELYDFPINELDKLRAEKIVEELSIDNSFLDFESIKNKGELAFVYEKWLHRSIDFNAPHFNNYLINEALAFDERLGVRFKEFSFKNGFDFFSHESEQMFQELSETRINLLGFSSINDSLNNDYNRFFNSHIEMSSVINGGFFEQSFNSEINREASFSNANLTISTLGHETRRGATYNYKFESDSEGRDVETQRTTSYRMSNHDAETNIEIKDNIVDIGASVLGGAVVGFRVGGIKGAIAGAIATGIIVSTGKAVDSHVDQVIKDNSKGGKNDPNQVEPGVANEPEDNEPTPAPNQTEPQNNDEQTPVPNQVEPPENSNDDDDDEDLKITISDAGCEVNPDSEDGGYVPRTKNPFISSEFMSNYNLPKPETNLLEIRIVGKSRDSILNLNSQVRFIEKFNITNYIVKYNIPADRLSLGYYEIVKKQLGEEHFLLESGLIINQFSRNNGKLVLLTKSGLDNIRQQIANKYHFGMSDEEMKLVLDRLNRSMNPRYSLNFGELGPDGQYPNIPPNLANRILNEVSRLRGE